jgi:hypothetical protein
VRTLPSSAAAAAAAAAAVAAAVLSLLLLLLVMLFFWPSCIHRYNFLLYVPYQLERIMIFGTLLCFYSFLVRGWTPFPLWTC